MALDSNVLIYLLEGARDLADKAAAVVDAIAGGRAEGVISTLALTEICTGPALAGDLGLVERFADEIRSLENVRVVPLSADLAIDAAVLRGSVLSLPDAIHLASARSAGATLFVTNDRRIKAVPNLEVAYLDEFDTTAG